MQKAMTASDDPPVLDRELLEKLLAMIGSSHDGEALAAARKADALVKRAGLTWREVLAGRNEPRPQAEAPPAQPARSRSRTTRNRFTLSDQDVIDALLTSRRVPIRIKRTVESYADAMKHGELSRDDRAHLRNLYAYLRP